MSLFLSLSLLGGAGETAYRLAVNDRLTSQSLTPLSGAGRCMSVEDFARLTGVELRQEAQATLLKAGEQELNLDTAAGAGFPRVENRLFAPVAFLCLHLGFSCDINPQYGYVRIVTSDQAMPRDQFIRRFGGPLETERIQRSFDNHQVTRGILVVNDTVASDVLTILASEKCFVPLMATAQALGGSVAATSSPLALRVQSAKGKRTLSLEANPVVCRGFKIHGSGPALESEGLIYAEASWVASVFGAQVSRFAPGNAVRLVTVPNAKPGEMLLLPSPRLNAAVAAADKANRAMNKVVYLTFDDGPSANNTPQVLDILKQNNAKATFFILGRAAKAQPALLKRIHDEGHSIGNHSYSHDYKKLYSSAQVFMDEVHQTDNLFQELLGVRSKMVRAPGGTVGHFKADFFDRVHAEGFKLYQWTIDSGDSKSLRVQAETIIANVERELKKYNEAIILFHDSDTKKETVRALPVLIEYLRREGYDIRPLTPETQISGPRVIL
jgi:peptidoglycan/xylan/chitin deacetylase (PgdA/CDA1 family)